MTKLLKILVIVSLNILAPISKANEWISVQRAKEKTKYFPNEKISISKVLELVDSLPITEEEKAKNEMSYLEFAKNAYIHIANLQDTNNEKRKIEAELFKTHVDDELQRLNTMYMKESRFLKHEEWLKENCAVELLQNQSKRKALQDHAYQDMSKKEDNKTYIGNTQSSECLNPFDDLKVANAITAISAGAIIYEFGPQVVAGLTAKARSAAATWSTAGGLVVLVGALAYTYVPPLASILPGFCSKFQSEPRTQSGAAQKEDNLD